MKPSSETLLLALGLVLTGPVGAVAVDQPGLEPVNTAVEVKLEPKATQAKIPAGGVIGPVKKAFGRYLSVAARQAPLLMIRSNEKAKDFSYSVWRNEKGHAIVFITHNRTDKARTLSFTLDIGEPLPPTYRRVYSVDRGKTWKTIAFEPPHSSVTGHPEPMPSPYVIEIPPNSYQTVTVRVKR